MQSESVVLAEIFKPEFLEDRKSMLKPVRNDITRRVGGLRDSFLL